MCALHPLSAKPWGRLVSCTPARCTSLDLVDPSHDIGRHHPCIVDSVLCRAVSTRHVTVALDTTTGNATVTDWRCTAPFSRPVSLPVAAVVIA
eukprot:m51a1_g52 hypothetical protein (93) ;mRNA; f:172174-172452